MPLAYRRSERVIRRHCRGHQSLAMRVVSWDRTDHERTRFQACRINADCFWLGALWWAERRLLCVSDLHLGKSDRVARRSGTMLPPYETQETLARLEKAIQSTIATTIVCLGDSFDDAEAEGALDEAERLWLARMQAGRRWIWIAGNHDPGPIGLGGSHLAEYHAPPLSFRHIARASASGEISGHFTLKRGSTPKAEASRGPVF